MPRWQILTVRSGQPETLLEASKAWTWEQRLSARMSFSLVYHDMLNDLMRYGAPQRFYSRDFAGAAVSAHAWRTHSNVCLYATTVAFDGTLPPPDSGAGLDALAYEAFDQTSVSIITCLGKTWLFEQMQGEPILSPLLAAYVDVDDAPTGFCDDGDDTPLQDRPTQTDWGRARETETVSVGKNYARLDTWLLRNEPPPAPASGNRKQSLLRVPRRNRDLR